MTQYSLSKLPSELKDTSNIMQTKYDNLFEEKIISRGRNYYYNDFIYKFKNENAICEAIVIGNKDYDVKINLKGDKIDNLYCSCPYHASNTYCKHIYAVLYKIHNDKLIDIYLKSINTNLDTINKIINDIKNKIDKYKKLILKKDKELVLKEIDRVEKFLLTVNLNLNKLSDIRILEYRIESETEILINYYDRFNEYIARRQKEKEQRKLDKLEESLEYEDDELDPLFDKLDAYIESMPMEVLKKARLKTIEDNEDTNILDKAIRNKEKKEKVKKNNLFGMFFLNLLFDNKKENKPSNTHNNYESYNYEEQELEEDDFYYDDLD